MSNYNEVGSLSSGGNEALEKKRIGPRGIQSFQLRNNFDEPTMFCM